MSADVLWNLLKQNNQQQVFVFFLLRSPLRHVTITEYLTNSCSKTRDLTFQWLGPLRKIYKLVPRKSKRDLSECGIYGYSLNGQSDTCHHYGPNISHE
ncbi:hypothetical protein TNCV_1869231 [Trichonephila clavipes]|nr:hypothetical protein TNCV_1869231 [Trichonephila clavipes]